MTASSTQGIKVVLHPVSDLERSKALYPVLLGAPPTADSAYYVGFDVDGEHVGLLPGRRPQGHTSPVPFWAVSDIDSTRAERPAAGAPVNEPAHDVGGGR